VFVETIAGAAEGKCRILYVVGELHMGGLERQLYYLVKSLDRDRYRPAVAVWNYNARDVHMLAIQALGIPVYAMPNVSSRTRKLQAFRRLVRQLAPEVVHSYSFHTNVAAAWAVRGTQAVAVGSIRSDFRWAIESTGPLSGRLSARWPAYHISNSSLAAESALTTHSFFAPRRCAVVTNGLDLERFRKSPPRMKRPVEIVGVGYLLPVKRWDRLLRAARELKARGADCRIRIVGGGPLRDMLERQAHELGVRDRLQLQEHTDDVPGLLAESSFLVLTSETEGCPNAIMEAMACGRAVVATDVGDVPKLVQDGRTGFLVRSGDDAMLADRMEELIRDAHLCARMGEAGRDKAERDFGLDRFVHETLAAYRDAGWIERDGARLEQRSPLDVAGLLSGRQSTDGRRP
jgi:glycosyltransferase involved in cell wall biosynthesis